MSDKQDVREPKRVRPSRPAVKGDAWFSECRRYRYALLRNWSGFSLPSPRFAMFVGLNPSTADETKDDPTIRRCMAYAESWGYSSLLMLNLFAFRATDPRAMLDADDPVGEHNDRFLLNYAVAAGVVVAAWGTHGTHRGRDAEVKRLLPGLHYLRLTKDGHPGHPLYLPADLTPLPWYESA